MLKQVSEWLHRVSTGWITLSALVVFLLFSALVLPGQAARSETDTGTTTSPDTSFTYSVNDLYRMAESYGEGGRAAYVRARFTFDLIWPVVYVAFLTTTISWVYGRAFPTQSRWRQANLIPMLGVAFDLMENLSTSLVMIRYPDRTAVVDVLAPGFTTVKWILVGSSFLLLLIGLAAGVWQWSSGRGAKGEER